MRRAADRPLGGSARRLAQACGIWFRPPVSIVTMPVARAIPSTAGMRTAHAWLEEVRFRTGVLVLGRVGCHRRRCAQRPRSSRHTTGHRQRCTVPWPARRGRLRRPGRCARRGLRRGHPSRGRPGLQHAAPAQPATPATPLTPPPPGRAPTTGGTGATGHLGAGITSPGVAGGTTATAHGAATAGALPGSRRSGNVGRSGRGLRRRRSRAPTRRYARALEPLAYVR
jgi:hypothetical protein